MQFSKRLKCLVFVAVILAAAAVGFNAYLGYSVRHMQFDLTGFGVFLDKLAATVEIATLTVPRCGNQPDYSSLGDQRREATMLYVATIVDLYKTTFGKLPDSIDDLNKLPSFDNADRLNGRQVKKTCSLHVRTTESYILACGGSLPTAKEIDEFLRKAGPGQRFYMLDGTEILYVPAGGCS